MPRLTPRPISIFVSTLLVLALATVWVTTSVALPTIDDPVTDTVDVISAQDAERLRVKLYDHYQATGVQMAVLFVDTTGVKTIEDYSIAVAEQWEGGDARRDDGILLTFAIDDRRNRLELGYGIEGIITDTHAARMLDDATPLLREERYAEATEQIVDQVILRTETLTPGGERPRVLSSGWMLLAVLVLLWLGSLQGLFWTASRGTLKGTATSEEGEDSTPDHDSHISRVLFVLLGTVATLIPVGMILYFSFHEAGIEVDLLGSEFLVVWMIALALIGAPLVLLVGAAMPKPHQKPSPLFTAIWWAGPLLAIGAVFHGLELPLHWTLPLSSSALFWALAIWGITVGIGLSLFPRLPRGVVISLLFITHHIILAYPAYQFALETDLFHLIMTGSVGSTLYVIAWLLFSLAASDYRTDPNNRTFMSGTSGGSSGFSSSGSSSFSSSSGGFSGGGGSFGGGGASGSW